jgi:hypothetical protein
MTAADPVAARRRVVVVAGMHRAGTSVVARALQVLGLDLGDALMSADVRQNARGFFEDVDIVALDDALLDAEDADWKSVALLAGVDWSGGAHAAARSRARRLLDARLARTGSFAFKDPRVPRLLPFWQHVFADMNVDDAYVIAVRHPLAVIDSLTARDGLDFRRSGWLWAVHLVCALWFTQGRPRIVVDYDRLLAAPDRELARMAAMLGVPGTRLGGAAANAYAHEFLAADLRHAQYAPDVLAAAEGLPLVADVHRLAQQLASDEADAGAESTIEAIGVLHERLECFAPLLAYAGDVERAADQVPRLEGEFEWARASLAAATTYNEDLIQRVERQRLEKIDAQAYIGGLEAALERKEAELVAAHAMLARIGDRVVGRMLLRAIERGR